ncbi:MAG: hypothetical protein V6Z81_00715 [Parvularculales bacterium]
MALKTNLPNSFHGTLQNTLHAIRARLHSVMLVVGLAMAGGITWAASSASQPMWETERRARFVELGALLNPTATEATRHVMNCIYKTALDNFGPLAIEDYIRVVNKHYDNKNISEYEHHSIQMFRPLFIDCSKEVALNITTPNKPSPAQRP